jgi:hypothetical protein
VAETETTHSFYTHAGISDLPRTDQQGEEDLEFLDCDDDAEILWHLLVATGLPTLAGIGVLVLLLGTAAVAILA